MSMEDGNEGKKKAPLDFDFRLMSIADADGNENEEKERLPLDLVHEVLSWSDVNSLAFCRLVCNKWQDFISMSHFVDLHLQRTKAIRGFFVQGDYLGDHNVSFVTHMVLPQPFSLDFLPEPVMIAASTGDQAGHGLLCCADVCERRYYVCKPTTREWNILPNPSRKFSTIKMGMGIVNMCTPPAFKIVRLSVNRIANTKTYYTEVFDSVNWEWKILQSVPRMDFSLLGPPGLEGAVVVINRSFYWLSIPLASKMRPPLIVSFDLETNEWSQVMLPETSVTDEAAFRDDAANLTSGVKFTLVNISGDLALVIQYTTLGFGSSQMDVWVMASKINQSWMKKESFLLDVKRGAIFLGFFAADAALVMEWKGFARALQRYDYKKNKSIKVGEDIKFYLGNAQLFQSDYVPCNFGKSNVIPPLNFYRPQMTRSKGERDLSIDQIVRGRERHLASLSSAAGPLPGRDQQGLLVGV